MFSFLSCLLKTTYAWCGPRFLLAIILSISTTSFDKVLADLADLADIADIDSFNGSATPNNCHRYTSRCTTAFQKSVFATTNPLLDRNTTKSLFPSMRDQGDDNQTCGLGSKYMFMDSCSQIHQPFTWAHPMPGLNVSLVERELQSKWNNVMDDETNWQYDAFFDNSVAYFVKDLTEYYLIWLSVGADIVLLRWYADTDENGSHPFYSLLTHNAHGANGTMAQFELISDVLDISQIDTNSSVTVLDSEMRAFVKSSDFDIYRNAMSGCDLYPIGVRRSVSNLEANLNWYQTLFSATIGNNDVITGEAVDYAGNSVKYAHVKLDGSYDYSGYISFFERSAHATHRNFSVSDWEEGMNAAHEKEMVSPFCGIDRWFDMHYALQISNNDAALQVLETLTLSGELYTIFIGPNYESFVYMPEPNGQSLQLVLDVSAVEWYVTPSQWRQDWCPISCSDDQMSYTFGERIFDISSSDSGGSGGKGGLSSDDIAAIVVVALLGCAGVIVVILCYRRAKLTRQINDGAPKRRVGQNTALLG